MTMRAALLILLLILGACSSSQYSNSNAAWSFSGKFSLRSAQKNQSGYIEWQQYEAAYAIRLWGSLGLGTTKIEGNATQLRIDTGKQQRTIENDDSIELLPGLDVPLASIAHEAEQLLRNCEVGSVKALSNASRWKVFCERVKIFDGVERPQKIRVSDGETTLTLLIKAWN